MSLKRGLERESCDFCFRRKIKCDRASRAVMGHSACSQCDLRQTTCTFESDDIRVQRRQKHSPRRGPSNVAPATNSPTGAKIQQQIGQGVNISSEGWSRTSSSLVTSTSSDTLPPTFHDNAVISSNLSLDNGIPTTTQSLMMASPLPAYRELEFELSPGGVSLLDSVFSQSHDTAEYTTNWATTQTQTPQLIDGSENHIATTRNPYCAIDTQPQILDEAIQAYFNFASLALPILSNDGFMADYKDHRSSAALVYAVACRGCPYIQSIEKWKLQQHFASRFRETFLQARGATVGQDVVRLDDLEALSIMLEFEYDGNEAAITPLQSQLQNLLLTNDALVSMTLQYRIETHFVTETGMSTSLSRSVQRLTRLYWYVYGWDAFCCIDRKMTSRIQDEDIDLVAPRHTDENQSYFGTILSLATIARKMAQTLCSPVARRRGIKHYDIKDIYKALEDWRTNVCPSALRIEYSIPVSPQGEKTTFTGEDVEDFLPLHKAIVALLELSCTLQVEACVSEYGIEERDSLMGQIADMQVKFESLQAANKVVEVARWMESHDVSQRLPASTGKHSMADLAPGIIRNICAGASSWLSRRAKETLHSTDEGLRLTVGRPGQLSSGRNNMGLSKERGKSWIESLITLRNVVASATSHSDTKCFIEHVDQQLESLKDLANIDDEHHPAY